VGKGNGSELTARNMAVKRAEPQTITDAMGKAEGDKNPINGEQTNGGFFRVLEIGDVCQKPLE